jgi:hypothetical protein
MIERVLKHITAFKKRKAQPLLEVIYGPRALPLRTACAALLLDRKVTGSDPEAQYGRLRKRLLAAVNVAGQCTAAEDADFEAKAQVILTAAVEVSLENKK